MDDLLNMLKDFCEANEDGEKPDISGEIDESNKYVIKLPE